MKNKLKSHSKTRSISYYDGPLYCYPLCLTSYFLWCCSDASGHCFIWINLHLPFLVFPISIANAIANSFWRIWA